MEYEYVVIHSQLTDDEVPLCKNLDEAKEKAFTMKKNYEAQGDDVEVSIAKIIYDVDVEITCKLTKPSAPVEKGAETCL